MNGVILAVLAGVAGAALGALLGLLFDRVRRRRSPAPAIAAAALALLLAGWAALLTRTTAPPVEAQMDEASPAAQAVHRYFPDTFAKLAADARATDPKDRDALEERFRARYSALMAAHRSEMNDASAEDFGKLMLEETRALRLSNPEACVSILHGGAVSAEVAHALTPDLLHRSSEVTARLIEQVATQPAPPPEKLSEPEASALATQAFNALDPDDRRVVMPLLGRRFQSEGREQARALCAFYRAYFEAALNGPAGTLRRALGD
ncbi:MAG: hypothetical protein ACJ798_18945 [Phenylobacterium sp.]